MKLKTNKMYMANEVNIEGLNIKNPECHAVWFWFLLPELQVNDEGVEIKRTKYLVICNIN